MKTKSSFSETNKSNIQTGRAEPANGKRYGSPSSLKLYMNEIGKTKLLTLQEEFELAARIKKGDAAAREQMIVANLRLVVKIARNYEHIGLPLLDLINEGNIGLMKAVERFDPAKGAKLSHYSTWWIRQAMRQALADQTRTIRVPVHMVDDIRHLSQAESRLSIAFGRKAYDWELASELGTTVKKIKRMRASTIVINSLDAPLGNDGDTGNLADVVEDTNAANPGEAYRRRTDSENLKKLLGNLPSHEAKILCLHYGLNGDEAESHEKIGKKFGVTRERVRQLEAMALSRLRRAIHKQKE